MQQDSVWMQLLILCRQLGNMPQQAENFPVYLTGVKANRIKYNDAIEARSVLYPLGNAHTWTGLTALGGWSC